MLTHGPDPSGRRLGGLRLGWAGSGSLAHLANTGGAGGVDLAPERGGGPAGGQLRRGRRRKRSRATPRGRRSRSGRGRGRRRGRPAPAASLAARGVGKASSPALPSMARRPAAVCKGREGGEARRRERRGSGRSPGRRGGARLPASAGGVADGRRRGPDPGPRQAEAAEEGSAGPGCPELAGERLGGAFWPLDRPIRRSDSIGG